MIRGAGLMASELPLLSSWERMAVKSLAQCLYLLSHGQFTSPEDLANWLQVEAEALALLSEEADANDETSRFPFINQDDPNKPGVGDQF